MLEPAGVKISSLPSLAYSARRAATILAVHISAVFKKAAEYEIDHN
jgi:hypothetical protein